MNGRWEVCLLFELLNKFFWICREGETLSGLLSIITSFVRLKRSTYFLFEFLDLLNY
jgi:hypothetical protein